MGSSCLSCSAYVNCTFHAVRLYKKQRNMRRREEEEGQQVKREEGEVGNPPECITTSWGMGQQPSDWCILEVDTPLQLWLTELAI